MHALPLCDIAAASQMMTGMQNVLGGAFTSVLANWQVLPCPQDRLAGSKVFGEARIRYVQYFARTLLQQAKEMYLLAPHAAIYMVTQVRHWQGLYIMTQAIAL